MKRLWLSLCVLMTVSVGLHAQPVEFTASGTFTSRETTFDVASAVAFNAVASAGKSEPKILVVISDVVLNPEGVADFLDRKLAVEKLVKDNLTPIAYLEFTPQGAYRGLSYRFGPTHGCESCSGNLQSTVKLANGRLTGTVTGKDNERTLDIALDVPLLSDDHGTALPADGGEPGKTYHAYHVGLVAQDADAVKQTLTRERVVAWESAPKAGELEFASGLPGDSEFQLGFLASHHPIRGMKITKGWAKADRALLLFEGESVKGNVTGEVLLMKESTGWKVEDEIIDLVAPEK